MVIFTTAFSEHAVQSFELDAVDYLLKPFSLPRFLKACNKADELQRLRGLEGGVVAGPATLFIKDGYEQVKVDRSAILWVESMGNYVRFVLRDGQLMSRLTMDQAAAMLPAGHFIRTSRSYLVAAEHITKIEKGSVWIGEREIPVGDRYRADVERLLLRK
jgi:DNA-binding LytR/AlgR family response regulator